MSEWTTTTYNATTYTVAFDSALDSMTEKLKREQRKNRALRAICKIYGEQRPKPKYEPELLELEW